MAVFVIGTDALRECQQVTSNEELVYFGFWGPIFTHDITPSEAAAWCQRAWDHDTWAEILALIILGILGGLFTMVTFAYYRQLLNPSSFANSGRAPSHQVRFGSGYPDHYNPPFYPYDGRTQYAPPPGPPPGHEPYDGKPPGYAGYGYGYNTDVDSKNPFSDSNRQERDVTSRPYPGGSETFHH
ncbi:hypothetical protein C0993_000329 [Termitomyces sp. T159_Od127]|nr:hypothetical protein C0993_000329 [Termitomyces sp. T159_Od127]